MALSLQEYAKRLGIDTEKVLAQGETSAPKELTAEEIEQGKKGWQKYLDDQETKKSAPKYDLNNDGKDALWEKILGYLGGSGGGVVDTTLPMGATSQVVNDLRADDSYMRPGDDWTDSQKYEFGRLYTEDAAKAYAYAEVINNQNNKAKKEAEIKKLKESVSDNGWAMAGHSLGSIASAPLGLADYLNDLAMTAAGREVDTNGDISPFEYSQAVRESIGTELNRHGTLDENIPIIGGKGWGDAYGLGMSIADSVASGLAFGGVGTLINFFGQSASRAYKTAYERGASSGQAALYSVLMGAAEAIPEMFSTSHLLKLLGMGKAGKEATKSLFREVLKQAGGEAAEEATTSLLNLAIDKMVFGETEAAELTRQYEATGLSHDEAVKKAWLDTFEGVLFDAVSGAISGGVTGGGAAMIQTSALNPDNKNAVKTLGPKQAEILKEGAGVKDKSAKAVIDKIGAKAADGKKLSGFELRQLSSAITEGRNKDAIEKVRLAIARRLMNKGENSKNIPALTDIILEKALGNGLNVAQSIRLKNSEIGTQVSNEIDADNMLSGNFDSEWARDAGINKIRDTSGAIKRYMERAEAQAEKADASATATNAVNLSTEAKNALRKAFTGQSGVYTPQSENTRIHTDEVKSTLNAKQTAQIRAIEKVANALGIDTYIYESEVKNGERSYTTKDGEVITDNGYYDPKDKSVHIDLHAGENGEGTMLFTASHELVHWVKDNAQNQYEALQKFVLGALGKEGVSIDKLVKKQIDKAKQNGRDMSRDEALEEIVADACMTVLSTEAGINKVIGLKTENRGLWNTLKRFFTNRFKRIDAIYKGVEADSDEGRYLASMRKEMKRLTDIFAEGAQTAAKNTEANETKAEQEEAFEKSYLRSKNIKSNARLTATHRAKLAAMSDSASAVAKDKLLERYDAIAKVWNEIGGELNSNFLETWNNKEGKDRVFTIFKAQSGYKYNVELSSMCKKGIPLFEAIDTIVREEILNQLETKTLGKAEKEILYDLLKERGFDIPCAICYVEQARQREGAIIDAFLDGKIEKSKTGKVTQFKIGWNETYDALEKGMKSLGVDYKFPTVDRSIATDNYKASDAVEMDAKTQEAFYSTLLALINKEIRRYNSVKDANAKARMPLKSITPSEIKRCLSGTLGSNLKLYKTIATNPASRFRIQSDLLYSSMTTTNLATAHPQLYSLFNSQGGVSTFKTKQATAIYWADILNKKWDASKLRKEGGVRNQSNSDFMMYTLLDHAQMYIDFTAKGYYLQAYTKVLAELKLFGLSRGKINASFIPKVTVYYNEDGTVDYDKTRENAGLDENGNPIYDDIEGVNHAEAFMLLEDAEYSKSIGGICIGYSDKHISKLLDDNRIQQIIGFHDKTDDPTKRYRGARYAKNYNGENEAQKQHSDGTLETIHIGFNQYVIAAEKLFKKDKATETYSGTAEYKGKKYNADDIPRLAADMYLEMCHEKNYIPAYQQFASHLNYYKLLADFSLKDANGHYAPHQKVAYNMPDVVPYLDENGKKQYMPTRDYIKQELKKELTVRDDIAAALSDHSEEGLIPQFVNRVNALHSEKKASGGNNVDIKASARYNKRKFAFQYDNFPAENEVASEAHRLAVWWARKSDTQVGDQTLISMNDRWYLVEKFEDALNYYQVQDRLTNAEYKKIFKEIKEYGRSGQIISISGSTNETDSLHRQVRGSLGREESSADRNQLGHRGENNAVQRLGEIQVEGRKRSASDRNGDSQSGGENRQRASSGIKSSARKSITPEMDASYLAAVNRGDMETAQRMVDEVAREAGYTIKGFHATNADFTEFDVSKTSDINYHGKGIYFTNSHRDVENNYENYEAPDPWQKIEGEAYELLYERYGYSYEDTLTNDLEIIDKLNECYDELIDKFKKTLRRVTAYLKFDNPLVIGKHETIQDYDITKYDGIIDKHVYETIGQAGMDENTVHYIVWNPKNIKSAEAITYDDNGNVIPLSERFNSAQSDIRYSSRKKRTVSTDSLPFVSDTAGMIVSDIAEAYEPTKKDKLETAVIASQIAFTNAQAGIEAIAKKYGIKNMESLVQAARVASHQAEEMITGNQYRIGSDSKDYLGEGLQKIMQPIEAQGEAVKQAFFDYLFHQHNADRMSLERRSIEWNEETKAELTKQMKRFAELETEWNTLKSEREKVARRRDKAAERGKIDLRLSEIKRERVAVNKLISKLRKQVDDFVPMKNKPVLALNREQIEARKAEIAEQIEQLEAERKELGRSKANASRVTDIKAEIASLKEEEANLSAEVTEEQSRAIIEQYEKAYPDFTEVAEKIWKYNANLNQYRVDTGLITQDAYDYMQKLYPHYVPTYRDGSSTGIAAVKGKNNLAVSKTVKNATGSTRDLLNPIVIMARQTMETVRAGRVNQIATVLFDAAGNDKTYLAEVSRKKVKASELVDLDPTELRPKANQVTFFKDGKRVVMQVSTELFAGFDAFSPQVDIKNPLLNGVSKANDIFKRLVTSANPIFLLRNSIRDIQDAGLNTKYPTQFLKNYARAIKMIQENGELWNLYKAMGGSNQSYFDFDKGFKMEQTKRGFSKEIKPGENATKTQKVISGAKSMLAKMESANAYVELLPRFAEFISSIEAGNTAEQAMLDAADVTTNFARTGKVTKVLNNTVIPFLNPAIQGASKAIRNVTSVKTVRQGLILATKAAIVGIAPFLLNALLYNDDEDYKMLRETDKENNHLIKIGDIFLKIPRGRMASVLAGLSNRIGKTASGEDADWAGYLKNASTQMNPFENMARTIFSPFLDVANNVTWYGSAIEGREFENKSPKERYDENTSAIAIAIGKVINYSPKKIHYLLDQYSGVIGDFLLPATTKKAEKDFLSGNLTIDPVTSNKLSDSFYDIYYEAQYAKSADENNKTAEYQVKHLNRVKSAISELFDEKSRIQSSDLSDKEKLEQTRAIQVLINKAYQTAIDDYELVTKAIEATANVDDKYRYAEITRLVYGADAALEVYDKNVYEKSKTMKKAGISSDVFYKYYFSTADIKSDVDKKGNTIPGSKREKTVKAIEKLKLSQEKKLLLIASKGYALKDNEDAKLIKYLNSLKLSATAKLNLAEMCGYTVKNGKIVNK